VASFDQTLSKRVLSSHSVPISELHFQYRWSNTKLYEIFDTEVSLALLQGLLLTEMCYCFCLHIG
jgi:hypothetical protein